MKKSREKFGSRFRHNCRTSPEQQRHKRIFWYVSCFSFPFLQNHRQNKALECGHSRTSKKSNPLASEICDSVTRDRARDLLFFWQSDLLMSPPSNLNDSTLKRRRALWNARSLSYRGRAMPPWQKKKSYRTSFVFFNRCSLWAWLRDLQPTLEARRGALRTKQSPPKKIRCQAFLQTLVSSTPVWASSLARRGSLVLSTEPKVVCRYLTMPNSTNVWGNIRWRRRSFERARPLPFPSRSPREGLAPALPFFFFFFFAPWSALHLWSALGGWAARHVLRALPNYLWFFSLEQADSLLLPFAKSPPDFFSDFAAAAAWFFSRVEVFTVLTALPDTVAFCWKRNSWSSVVFLVLLSTVAMWLWGNMKGFVRCRQKWKDFLSVLFEENCHWSRAWYFRRPALWRGRTSFFLDSPRRFQVFHGSIWGEPRNKSDRSYLLQLKLAS